jgi:peptidyl-prolyl cis-trans isomerase SurA
MVINNKIFIFVMFVLLIFNLKVSSKEDVSILYKVNNRIITNIDIKKETQYLIALNNQLTNLKKNEILKISRESALREKIKEIELLKYFDLESTNKNINQYLENMYLRLRLSSAKEFEEHLNKYGLTLGYVEKKIKIEMYWNKLIYDKHISQISIDKSRLKDEIKKNKDNLKDKLYQLSEIIFEIDNKISFDKKNKEIVESIGKIGFKNTANIYSISDSSKLGGDIGWIEEAKLSKNILDIVSKLNIGEYTMPIQVGSNYLILKLDEIKFKEKINDVDEELKKRIQFDTSRQLERFSKIYYNKVKINSVINEK